MSTETAALTYTDLLRIECLLAEHAESCLGAFAATATAETHARVQDIIAEMEATRTRDGAHRRALPVVSVCEVDPADAVQTTTPRRRQITGRSALRVQPEQTTNPQREY